MSDVVTKLLQSNAVTQTVPHLLQISCNVYLPKIGWQYRRSQIECRSWENAAEYNAGLSVLWTVQQNFNKHSSCVSYMLVILSMPCTEYVTRPRQFNAVWQELHALRYHYLFFINNKETIEMRSTTDWVLYFLPKCSLRSSSAYCSSQWSATDRRDMSHADVRCSGMFLIQCFRIYILTQIIK